MRVSKGLGIAAVLAIVLTGCKNEASDYDRGYEDGCADGHACGCGGFLCDATCDDPCDGYNEGYRDGYQTCSDDGEADWESGDCPAGS